MFLRLIETRAVSRLIQPAGRPDASSDTTLLPTFTHRRPYSMSLFSLQSTQSHICTPRSFLRFFALFVATARDLWTILQFERLCGRNVLLMTIAMCFSYFFPSTRGFIFLLIPLALSFLFCTSRFIIIYNDALVRTLSNYASSPNFTIYQFLQNLSKKN